MDTSAFYALLDRDDRWHQPALHGFQRLAAERRPLVTTNLVVSETHALVTARLGGATASRWLGGLMPVNLVFQREEHHARLLELLDKHQGARYSYTDAFSFLVMGDLGLRLAFSFDGHFAQYGWELVR